MISIVNTANFDATSGGPSDITIPIPSTTAGNTIILAILGPGSISGGSPTLQPSGTTLIGHEDEGFSGNQISSLENIPANQTSITYSQASDLYFLVFELTPCTSPAQSVGVKSGSGAGSFSGPVISGSGNCIFFGLATTVNAGTGVSISGPYTNDVTVGFGSSRAGCIGHLLNATGIQTAVFAGGSGGAWGSIGAVYQEISPTYILTPNPGPSGGPVTVGGPPIGPPITVTVGGVPVPVIGTNPIVFVPTTGGPVVVNGGINVGTWAVAPCAPPTSTYISKYSLAIAPTIHLLQSVVPSTSIVVSDRTDEGRDAIVMDFNAGDGLYSVDLGTIFAWTLNNTPSPVLRIWQPSLIEQPESVYNRPGDWMDGGYPGAKYVQGTLVQADSFGVPKTFSLQSSDDQSIHALLECPATFNKQSEIAFSCVPFVAHNVRRVATDGIAWRVWNERLVFQPYPELTMNWTVAPTTLGLTGWGHIREMNIAHISSASLTLTLSFDAWPMITISIPSSLGLMQKVKITLPANKFKLVQPSLTSPAPFRLFATDLEMKVGQWGRSDPYKVLKPFGGPNQPGAEV